jgi:two-component system nitrate/nitrite response regulator NarL
MIGRVIRSVLVVDDDPEFRKLAGRLLAASGMTVVGGADSVAGAVEAAARLEPSAVLVDVELPDGDGITLARQLVPLPWHPRVVLTSIDGEITTTHEARRAGARAFVNEADCPTCRCGGYSGTNSQEAQNARYGCPDVSASASGDRRRRRLAA